MGRLEKAPHGVLPAENGNRRQEEILEVPDGALVDHVTVNLAPIEEALCVTFYFRHDTNVGAGLQMVQDTKAQRKQLNLEGAKLVR